ncbi:hypothetical protein HSX11_19100 [Oxalobacteraceae bacterium]|nr:hypothetical protein [Oxalobacteraceae bacterium]
MKSMKLLAVATLMALANLATAAAPATPDAAQVKAAHDLLASMQAEKMLRMTAGMSRYSDPKQRDAIMAKLDKTSAESIYQRMAEPVARLLTLETATEMTRFYQSSYGQRVLQQTYNSAASLGVVEIKPSAAEKIELAKPAYKKADKAFKEAEPAIHHEAFVLIKAIASK